ncbi:hypothetical protein VTJ04DRAFT_5116 [Mycothermus thermophilus]|uniref:uncharacterized protein n=1 Tax=Humicola insolens TaxID=85995 RepID=UPI0037425F27
MRRKRVDARVVRALTAAGVVMKKKEVQDQLCGLVGLATTFASSIPRGGGADPEGAAFKELIEELHKQHPLGRHLSVEDMEELLGVVLAARYRFKLDREDRDLPDLPPAALCPLAQAVDAFEDEAWFWSPAEAFLEDDLVRAEEAEAAARAAAEAAAAPRTRERGSEDESSDEDDRRKRQRRVSPSVAAAAAPANPAAPNDPGYLALSEGVKNLVLPKEQDSDVEMGGMEDYPPPPPGTPMDVDH